MNAFDINYAHKCTTVGQLTHHLCDVSSETLVEIKKQFSADKKKEAMFKKATRGWAEV